MAKIRKNTKSAAKKEPEVPAKTDSAELDEKEEQELDEAARKAALKEFAESEPKMTALSDHPLYLDKGWVDRFNFPFQLGAVYDIIRHKDTATPLAIGIYGDWGTGKTSAMKWLEGLLKTWNKSGGKSGEKVKTIPVWFYPWKYQTREDVWRGIVAEIVLATTSIQAASPERVVFAAKRFGAFLGRSFIRALASIKVKVTDPTSMLAEGEITLESLEKTLEDFKDVNHPERSYLNQFESMLSNWVTQNLGKNERLVLFIDDLDRCLPDVTLEVLEAIKLYLNIPNLIFVVGLDRSVVESIVLKHYDDRGVTKEKAKDYLAKMFQVEVHLFRMEQDVEDFIDDQLKTFQLWETEVDDRAKKLLKERFAKHSANSPREVKRVVNAAMIAARGWTTFSMGKDQERLTFSEGLIRHFVRLHLREMGSESVLSTKEGNEFLAAWSEVAVGDKTDLKCFEIPVDDSASDKQLSELNIQKIPTDFQQIWKEYPKLRRLLKDKILGSLLSVQEFRTSKALVVQETRAPRINISLKYMFLCQTEHKEYVAKVTERVASRIGEDKVYFCKHEDLSGTDPWSKFKFDFIKDVFLQSETIVLFVDKDYRNDRWMGLGWETIQTLLNQRQDTSIFSPTTIILMDDEKMSEFWDYYYCHVRYNRSASELARIF